MVGPKPSLWLFVLVFQTLTLSFLATASGASAKVGHANLACKRCHLAGDQAAGDTARRLTTTQERMCGRCHQTSVEASHPSGFAPDRPLPAEFPLDWKRHMTCSTCHDFHGGAPKSLRRVSTGQHLCLSCHTGEFFGRMPDGGESLITSGHLALGGLPPPLPVDRYTSRCVECHDDRLSLPNDGIKAAFTASNGTGMMNHPVGMTYRDGDPRRDLRHRAMLPANMLLPEGKVSCLSCHRGYSAKHGELLRSDLGLCQQCHDK